VYADLSKLGVSVQRSALPQQPPQHVKKAYEERLQLKIQEMMQKLQQSNQNQRLELMAQAENSKRMHNISMMIINQDKPDWYCKCGQYNMSGTNCARCRAFRY
jgi:hypothetical protein